MIIGNFKKSDEHNFRGAIHTLTLNLEVAIQAVAEKKGDKAPDYRITTGHTELGAAWKETSGAGNVYLSVKLDDPALPYPINCALVKTGSELGYALVWERKRKAKTDNAPSQF